MEDAMLPWLAQAARELRERKGRKLVNVASSLGASESTVWRFENSMGWPERPDLMIAAYADDLDIEPLAIWEHALELWERARSATEGVSPAPGELGRRARGSPTTPAGQPQARTRRAADGKRGRRGS
jgi:hypothetical protein